MTPLRTLAAALVALLAFTVPARAARPIVDLHKLDAYFALFASDSNVPWRRATVRLDTYSGAPVDFSVYEVDPADVLTAGSNARPRAIDTRRRRAVITFRYSPPGGYQFQSNQVEIPLGSREGFFVVEARRGNVGEQVWINRTRIGLLTKETPGELALYGADLATGRALHGMRVQFVTNGTFTTRATDTHGIIRWTRSPRPVFALAQWGNSYAFASLLPQAPLPAAIVGVRTDSAVVHAGDAVHVIGFARTRGGSTLRSAGGNAELSLRLGGTVIAQTTVPLDAAGAFSATLPVPATAGAGDYALLAQAAGAVGGATVHVDANADGISLQVNAACETACDARNDLPLDITSSRAGVPVRVRVVRSPHVFVGYAPQAMPWGTTTWLDQSVRTGADGRATVVVPHPNDGLGSTYGVEVSAGGATANTRIVVPTGRRAVRLSLERSEQTLGTAVNFDVYVNDIGTGNALPGVTVTAALVHGPSRQEQRLTLDANGHAHGTFASPDLGMNMLFATLDEGANASTDAAQVDVVPQAAQSVSDTGSAGVRLALDRGVYHNGDALQVDAELAGAQGDALVTLESAENVLLSVNGTNGGSCRDQLHVSDALGELRVGAAFVHDGALEWSSTPLALDAPGRPHVAALDTSGITWTAGSTVNVPLRDVQAGDGTVAVRVSRGTPSGSALFDTAPSLLAIGLAATQVSAPAGTTWHPWVDSRGEHAQVIGFERRSSEPPDLTVAQAATQAVSWNVARSTGSAVPVQLPAARGRYTLSVLKLFDDGRVVAGSSTIVVQ